MRRLLVAVSLIGLAFFLFGRPAEAGTGVTADPPNDVFDSQAQTSGPGPLDIVSVSHTDDGVRATYALTLKDGFDDADLHAVHIYLGGLPGVAAYDCVPVAAVVSRNGSQVVATLEHCLGSGSGPEGGPGGFDQLGPAYFSHSPGSDSLSISFDLASLRSAGFSGDRYDYSVWIAESGNTRSDATTDPVEHVLSPPPTPTPPPATPEPTTPPATQTPASTPAVAVTASNPPVVREESSFAAPEEASDDAFPVVPVAVGGGAVVAGAGLVAVRFWPF